MREISPATAASAVACQAELLRQDGYLLASGRPYYALALVGLVLPQIYFQAKYMLKDPTKYDVKYQVWAAGFTTALLKKRSSALSPVGEVEEMNRDIF